MNFLITGGSGLIGRELSLLLAKEINNKIYIIDKKKFKKKNNNIFFQKIDLFNINKLTKFIIKNKINTLIHLAAFLGVKETQKNPSKVIKMNLGLVHSVLQSSVRAKIKNFIFSSSSEIYGNKNISLNEKMTPDPLSLYGYTKQFSEIMIKNTCRRNKINFNIVRFFNVYSKLQRKSFVIPKFIDLAKKNKNLTIFGDGKQIRSFCHTKDAVNALVKLIKLKTKNSIYNIGNNSEPITMINLAKKIIKQLKSRSQIKKVKFSTNTRDKSIEIRYRIPNTLKLIKKTKFKPSTNLTKGIDEFLN